MADRNVPSTPSQEELRKNEIMKNVKNSEERETDSLNSNIDADSLPSVSTAAAVSQEARSSTTKIPGPIPLGPSTSTFHMSNRKYSSVLEILDSRQPSVNDSGIQIDSSISDGETTPVPATPYPVASLRSEMELQLAEQQTLKELQRVVAEMEAEVALEDEEEMEEQHQLEAAKAEQASPSDEAEQGSSQKQAPTDIQTKEENAGEKKNPLDEPKTQQDPVVNEAEQESAQNHVPDDVQDNIANSSQMEEPLTAFEAPQKPQAKEPGQESAQEPTEVTMVKSKPEEEPLVGQETPNNEVHQDNQLQQLTQIDEPEPVTDLLEPLPQVSELKLPQIVLEDPSARSVEAHLQQAFENVNRSEEQVFLEVPVDALIGATRGLIDDHNQDLLGETEPEVGYVDLVSTSEPALAANPSQANIHLDGSTGNNRLIAPLEELLGNPNNVELLRRLLQIRAEGNILESDTEFTTQETSGEEKETETDSGPGTSLTTATASGTEASTDEDAELDEDDTEEQGDKAKASLVRRLLSDKLMGLACPILFCGLAAGLIYLSRKA